MTIYFIIVMMGIQVNALQRNISARLLLLVLLASSCKVSMVAPYDETVVEQAFQIARQVDRFYLTMLEAPGNDKGDRSYKNFAGEYIDIEVELNDLLLKNKIRPLNSESVRNIEIAVETWSKYKQRHKKEHFISDADIELNRDFMKDLMMVIIIGEQAKSGIR